MTITEEEFKKHVTSARQIDNKQTDIMLKIILKNYIARNSQENVIVQMLKKFTTNGSQENIEQSETTFILNVEYKCCLYSTHVEYKEH